MSLVNDIVEEGKKAIDSSTNAVANLASAGLVGVDKGFRPKLGVTSEALNNGGANALVQFATAGLAGLDKGQVVRGGTVQAVDEGLGEVTGRNLQRKAAFMQKDSIDQAAIDAELARKNELDRRKTTDIRTSRRVAAAQRAALARQPSNLGGLDPIEGSSTLNDKLGL